MNLERLDHVAIEVSDLDYYVEQLVRTGGMKLELIENRGVARGAPRFLHVAFRSSDVDAAARSLVDKGWKWERGPIDLEEAQARSALLSDNEGFELQVLTYRPTSPDIVEWSDDKTV